METKSPQRSKLQVLHSEWINCTRCALGESRGTHAVFGSGNPGAEILVVVDAPDEESLAEGTIAGREAEVLRELLEHSGLGSGRAFVTPIVGCRPYIILPATESEPERIQDRAPAKEELLACYPRITSLIYTIDPLVIVAMGEAAWKSLVRGKDRGKANTLLDAAGSLYETRVQGQVHELRYPVLATLSPKQILDNPSSAAHGPIITTLQALKRLNTYLKRMREHHEQANSKGPGRPREVRSRQGRP